MTDEQIEAYRQRLNDLTAKRSDEQPELRIKEELEKLAREVGASTHVLWVHPTSSFPMSAEADTSELIRNIHQALQTATMINMCKTAARNYKIAIAATVAAGLSALAALIAVLTR